MAVALRITFRLRTARGGGAYSSSTRIADDACSPYCRRKAPVRKWAHALPAQYGVIGAIGVRSLCGTSSGAPNISPDAALRNRPSGCSRRSAFSSALGAAAAKVDVPTGSCQEAGTNETDAKW